MYAVVLDSIARPTHHQQKCSIQKMTLRNSKNEFLLHYCCIDSKDSNLEISHFEQKKGKILGKCSNVIITTTDIVRSN